jgi:hypothetical protein
VSSEDERAIEERCPCRCAWCWRAKRGEKTVARLPTRASASAATDPVTGEEATIEVAVKVLK